MKRTYYSGGVGEMFVMGDEPFKIADLERASLLIDYAMRPLGSDRDDFPIAVVAGPGTGTISCVARVFVEGNPFVGPGAARAFRRAASFVVPATQPFRIILPEEPLPESLVVETPAGDAFGLAGIPSAGKFSLRPEEKALYFSEEDAGQEILVSYAYGESISESWHSCEVGLILVFPALGRNPSADPAFRVIEARRAVVSSWSEEFSSGKETIANLNLILLADEDGFIVRERILEDGS
ncbi:MAG: hypothetical protein ACP5QG_03490 [candidate division WOR-3 bacterium]